MAQGVPHGRCGSFSSLTQDGGANVYESVDERLISVLLP